MAFTNEVSVGVGWGQRIRQVPAQRICVGWVRVGQRTAAEKRGSRGRQGLQDQEENDEPRESSPLPGKAALGESCPLRIRLTKAFPPVLWHLFNQYHCWQYPWRDSESSKQY